MMLYPSRFKAENVRYHALPIHIHKHLYFLDPRLQVYFYMTLYKRKYIKFCDMIMQIGKLCYETVKLGILKRS